MKVGLAALADTYGLERGEIHQLRLLAERFFDQFREEITRAIGRTLKVTDLVQGSASFVEFCSGPGAEHQVVLGFDGEAAFAVRLDHELVTVLLAAVLTGDPLAQPAPGRPRDVTLAEAAILNNILGPALTRAVGRVFGPLLGGRSGLDVIRIEHHAGLLADCFGPSEQLIKFGVKCLAGSAGGAIELGLPLSLVMQVRARLAPRPVRNPDPAACWAKLHGALSGATFELKATMGQQVLTLTEVRALVPGSLLMLRKLGGGAPPVELGCAGRPLFSGAVAEHHGWRRFVMRKKEIDHGGIDRDD